MSLAEQGLQNRYVICLTYADPRWHAAGLEKYLADEAALLSDRGISVVCLFPFPTQRSKWLNRHLSRFWGVIVDGRLRGFYGMEGVMGLLAEWQRAGKVPLEIQLHHLRNWDVSLVEHLLRRIPVDVRLFLHDFITICPQYNLLRNDKVYCGEAPPSEEKCGTCRWWTPAHLNSIQKVLNAAGGRLTVTAPSESARKIWVSSFPEYKSQAVVVPHLIPAGETSSPVARKGAGDSLRIAYLGASTAQKGWPIFFRLVEELAQANPSYEFYHFGRPSRTQGLVVQVPVSFIREGPDTMTKAMRQANIDIVLLWSICPETYSYTLQESRLAGAMVITNPDSGNIAATVLQDDAGQVFRDYDELLCYLKDMERVRSDVDEIRSRHSHLSARMEPNPSIADALAAKPPLAMPIEGGPARSCRHVDLLYRLKRMKRKWWNRDI